MFGEGISKEGEIIDYGVKLDIIDKSGAWFSYNDSKIGQGKENSKQFLLDNPEIALEIEKKILVSMGMEEEVEINEQ
jgi:recombination protein RecA